MLILLVLQRRAIRIARVAVKEKPNNYKSQYGYFLMAELDPLQKHKLGKTIKELSQYKGRHTELVSVYIPSGYELVKVIQQLGDEQGTASNIKSSATRKNVEGALEKMIQHLRLFKQTPKNCLAVFSGNVAEQEGKQDLRVWSVEPPRSEEHTSELQS